MEIAKKNPWLVGLTAGVAISAWHVMTMLLPVTYQTWDIGRSVLFIVLAVALIAVAAFRARASAMSAFTGVAVACLVAAGLTLSVYAISTRFFAHWIVQLPEYMADYSYHRYTSPQQYLATHYSELLGLQVFSWGIAVIGLVLICGAAGTVAGRRHSTNGVPATESEHR